MVFSSATLRTTGDWMVMWILPGGFSNRHVCIEVGAPTGICSKTTWVLSAPWKLRALVLTSQPCYPSSSDGRKPSLRPERNWPGATGCSCQTEELRCRPHPIVRMRPHSSQALLTTQTPLHSLLCKLTLCSCTNSSSNSSVKGLTWYTGDSSCDTVSFT